MGFPPKPHTPTHPPPFSFQGSPPPSLLPGPWPHQSLLWTHGADPAGLSSWGEGDACSPLPHPAIYPSSQQQELWVTPTQCSYATSLSFS